MAFGPGKDQTLSIDATDISAYTDNASFTKNQTAIDVSAFGDDDMEYIAGLKGSTLSASGHWDPTGDAALEGTFDGATVAWEYSPDNGTTTYSGNAIVTDYTVSGGVNDKVSWSVSLQVSGSVTRA